MPRHTLSEHARYPFDWTDQHLLTLEQLQQRFGTPILEATTFRRQRVLKAAAQVGVIRLGDDIFQILPKIDYGEDKLVSATRNLLYMLEQAGQFPVQQQDVAALLARRQNWFEILTRLFAIDLKTQWQQGAYRYYQQKKASQPTLKGKWLVQRQLRQPTRLTQFEVRFSEFTADNQLNRVFRFVVEQLWRQTRDPSNRKLLGELRQGLADVTLLPAITRQDVAPSLITRLNRRYKPLLNLARLFLQNGTLDVASGSLDTFAFVFDMNQLFEAFIIAFVQRWRREILPESLADCSLHPQTAQQTRHLARTEAERPIFRLIPDLALRAGNHFRLLLDTKYKLSTTNGRFAIASADFYQMFAYAHRYDCPHVLLLYPQTGEPRRNWYRLEGKTAVVHAATVNLHRNLNSKIGQTALKQELRDILSKTIEVNYVPTV